MTWQKKLMAGGQIESGFASLVFAIARFVRDSIRRSPRRKALIIAAIALGTSVATAMLGVKISIGDKMNVELRQAGANIVVTPEALTGEVGGVKVMLCDAWLTTMLCVICVAAV